MPAATKVSRPAVCCALDPLPSVSARGRRVHRHCSLPAGHSDFHASYDHEGVFIRGWWWADQVPPVLVEMRLFDG